MGKDFASIDVPAPMYGRRDSRDGNVSLNNEVKLRMHFDELIDNPILSMKNENTMSRLD